MALPSSAPTGRPQVPQATPRRPVRCGLRVPGPACGDRARRWPAHGAAVLTTGHGTSTFANAAFACCGSGMKTSCAAWTTCSMRSQWPSTANAGTSVGGWQRSPPQSLRDSSPRRGERLRRRRGPALALPSPAPPGRPQVPQATPRRPVRRGLRVPGPACGDRARRWPAHGAACLRQGAGRVPSRTRLSRAAVLE